LLYSNSMGMKANTSHAPESRMLFTLSNLRPLQGFHPETDRRLPVRSAQARLFSRTANSIKLLSFLLAAALVCSPAVRGQELMRESLAGADVADSAGTTSLEEQNYNLRLGPIRFLLSATAGFEYIDNIGYSEVHRESDVVARLALDIRSIWQITKLNTLNFDLGVGFVRYIDHPDATSNNLFITPGSQLAFDIYVADIFRINIHDSFQLLQDPVDQPSLSNVTNFGRFTNTAGVTTVADLNTLVLTAGYDHFNYIALNDDYNYLNRSAEQFLASAVYQIMPRTFLGIEGTYAITDYDKGVQNDSTGGTIGLYFDITPTPYLRFIVRGGYQGADFDGNGSSYNIGVIPNGELIGGVPPTNKQLSNGGYADSSTLSSFYWNFSANHRINAYLSENLSAGRENDLGLTSNYLEVNYVRYNAAWRALSNVTLGGDAFYENDQESGGPYDQSLQRFGGDITVGYQFNLQLSATAHYAYIKKDSDVYLLEYYQNRAGVDVTYQF
jgi:hypothetical protein